MAKIKLTVIVPAYNEENTIQEILQKLSREKDVYEVIVVENASQDQSYEAIQKSFPQDLLLKTEER